MAKNPTSTQTTTADPGKDASTADPGNNNGLTAEQIAERDAALADARAAEQGGVTKTDGPAAGTPANGPVEQVQNALTQINQTAAGFTKAADVAATGVETVDMFFPMDCNLRTDPKPGKPSMVIAFKKGINPVPTEHAGHPYLASCGATKDIPAAVRAPAGPQNPPKA